MQTNLTAEFRRYVGRSLSRRELLLIEHLERQRARSRRVRAYVHDPDGKMARVLCEYIRWHRDCVLPRKDAVVVTARTLPKGHPVASLFAPADGRRPVSCVSARRYMQLYARPQCVGQILLLGADAYCPSVPHHRSYLDAMTRILLPLLCGPNTVFIVCGNADRRRTRFRNLWRQWQTRSGERAVFLTLDSPNLQPLRRPLPPRRLKLIFALSVAPPPRPALPRQLLLLPQPPAVAAA